MNDEKVTMIGTRRPAKECRRCGNAIHPDAEYLQGGFGTYCSTECYDAKVQGRRMIGALLERALAGFEDATVHVGHTGPAVRMPGTTHAAVHGLKG